MNIWLDCTSLMGWEMSHLTGIQRSIIGIHKGWRSLGLEPLLYRYDQDNDCFVSVNTKDLPELIRLNLENQEWMETTSKPEQRPQERHYGQQPAEANTADFPGAKTGSARKRILRGLAGRGKATEEMIQSIAATNLALWKLKKATLSWLREQLGRGNNIDPTTNKYTALEIGEAISTEDYFFSFGTENFLLPASIKASQRLRAKGGKVIRLIYDVIPVSEPQWVCSETCHNFGEAMRTTLPSCDLILTISEYSRSDIISYAKKENIEHPPIAPIRLGDVISEDSTSRGIQHSISDKQKRLFFLCLGTIEPRKNHRLLYDCWRRLSQDCAESCPDLICIGAHHQMSKQLIHEITHDPLTKERITLLENIGDEQLEWYFDHCIATIFPSMSEGWGLPVAESLARGRLCLASNASSIPEISEMPLFFDPQDAAGLSELVIRVTEDREWRASEEEKVRTQFKPTTWAETAKQILEATESLRSAEMEAKHTGTRLAPAG
jgi:glycosyltransferase involved in cell wall biosynthesis